MKRLLIQLSLSILPLYLSAQPVTDQLLAQQHLEQMVTLLEEQQHEDSIIMWYNNAAEIFQKHDERLAFIALALPYLREIYSSGYLERANVLLADNIAFLLEQHPDSANLIADHYFERSRSYFLAGELERSLVYIEQGIEQRAIAAQDRSSAAGDDHNLLGVILTNLGKFESAKDNLELALQIFQEQFGPSSNEASRPLLNLGVLHQNFGYSKQALSYYLAALNIRREILGLTHPAIARVLINIGVTAKDKGEFQTSTAHLERALAIFSENELANKPFIARVYFNLGDIAYQTGNLALAESYFQNALNIFRSLPQKAVLEEVLVLRQLANLEAARSRLPETIRIRKEGLLLQEEIYGPEHLEVAIAYDNIGVDFRELGLLDSSLYYHRKALQLLQDGTHPANLANVYNNIADVYLSTSNPQAAQEEVRQALALQREVFGDRHPSIAYSYNTLARLNLMEGNYEQALQQAQLAIQTNHEVFNLADQYDITPVTGYLRHDYYFESIILKAAAFRKLEQLHAARDQYYIADQVLSAARNSLITREDKINQSRNVHRLSEAAIDLHQYLREAKPAENVDLDAFFFTEKSKAGVLLQTMITNQAKQYAGIPDSLVAREEQLQSDINYYNLQIADSPDDDQLALFQEELLSARQQYQALIAQFERDYPQYYELRYADQTPTVAKVQAKLPAGTAVVSYFTSDTVLYIFYLDQNRYQIHQSAIDNTFAEEVAAYRQTINERYDQAYPIMARRLYAKLFPFEIPQGIDKLVLVPDGQLTTVPFEALLREPVTEEAEVDFTTLPYLLRDYHISYAPSVAIYHQMLLQNEAQSSSRADGLMAYAPVFNDEEQLLAANTRRALEQIDGRQRLYTPEGNYITPLPGTAAELEKISRIFRQQQIPVQTFTHRQATEQQLKQAGIADCRYLHIATHGFINEEFPDLSGLLFYPDTSTAENHILNSGEVYGLKLNAELVTLSACETALGRINTGEGILGLSRAFLYAGADNLLVSLWKVDDEATADLMSGFYTHHLQPAGRVPFNQALRQAKLDMINSTAFSAPYYWSAFVLIGQ